MLPQIKISRANHALERGETFKTFPLKGNNFRSEKILDENINADNFQPVPPA